MIDEINAALFGRRFRWLKVAALLALFWIMLDGNWDGPTISCGEMFPR